MPIVDVHVVSRTESDLDAIAVQALADGLGEALGTDPGRTWVRLHWLPAERYAENQAPIDDADFPVFVTILRAEVPAREALEREVASVTRAVAALAHRPFEHVHVEYAAAALGRQAFGGKLVG